MRRMRARCSAGRHREREMERRGALIGVVRIDDDRFRQLARRTRELAQHQHAALVVARRDELLGHQIHPVVQTADEAQIRGAEILVDVLRLVMLDLEHHRRVGAHGRSGG